VNLEISKRDITSDILMTATHNAIGILTLFGMLLKDDVSGKSGTKLSPTDIPMSETANVREQCSNGAVMKAERGAVLMTRLENQSR
jgi:hypothetical protein